MNDAVEAGNCQVCTFILERRFLDEFGRSVYRKSNSVSENKNENIKITFHEADAILEKILEKFAFGRENREPSKI